MRNEVKILENGNVQVTKAFMRKAKIFGTSEYEFWKRIKADLPNAEMETKTTNRKPNKNKNRSYKKIKLYISTQENSEKLLAELEKVKIQSEVQTNPYEYILSWFDKNFPNYKESTVFNDTENPEEEKLVNIKSAA